MMANLRRSRAGILDAGAIGRPSNRTNFVDVLHQELTAALEITAMRLFFWCEYDAKTRKSYSTSHAGNPSAILIRRVA